MTGGGGRCRFPLLVAAPGDKKMAIKDLQEKIDSFAARVAKLGRFL